MWLGKQQYDPAWYSLGMRWPTGCIIDMFCLYNTSNNGNQTKKTRILCVTGISPCWWPCEMLFPSSLLVASPLSVCCPLTNLKLSWSLFFPKKVKHISQLGSTSQQGSKTTSATSKLCRPWISAVYQSKPAMPLVCTHGDHPHSDWNPQNWHNKIEIEANRIWWYPHCITLRRNAAIAPQRFGSQWFQNHALCWFIEHRSLWIIQWC
jgi:hypothetical protein